MCGARVPMLGLQTFTLVLEGGLFVMGFCFDVLRGEMLVDKVRRVSWLVSGDMTKQIKEQTAKKATFLIRAETHDLSCIPAGVLAM